MAEENIQQTKTKFCPDCKQDKSKDEFCIRRRNKFVFLDVCKECDAERTAKYEKEQPERDRIAARKSYHENKEFEDTNLSEPMLKEIEQACRIADQKPANPEKVAGFRAKGLVQPARPDRIIPPRKRKDERKTTLTRKLKFYQGTFYAGYRNLRALDLSRETIARLFGIKAAALKYQEDTDEKTEEAYQQAMAELQQKLSLLTLVRAYGYNYDEEKYISLKSKETGDWLEVKKEVVKKHQPGSDQLLIFFMTNKFPDKWKVSREILTGKAEGYDSKPSQRIRKAIESIGRDILEQNTDRPEAEHPVQDGLARVSGGSDQTGQK